MSISNKSATKSIPAATDILPNEIWRPRACDSHGHGVNLTVRVPPDIARMVSMLTLDPRFPYNERTDFLRHAIQRHITFCTAFPGNPQVPIGQIMAAESLCEIEESHQRFEKLLDRVHTIVQGLVNRGTEQSKNKAVAIVMQHLRYMQQTGDPYYDELFTQKIRNQHKDLLDQLPMLNPMDMAEEPLDQEDLEASLTEMESELLDGDAVVDDEGEAEG